MRKIRIFSLSVVLCILLVSTMGCGIAPSGNTTSTAPAGTPPGSPAVTEPLGDTPSPVPADTWKPVVEEDLSEQDLDAWMDMRFMMIGYGSLQDMRAHLVEYCPVVSVEVADAMAWAYCDALCKYKDTTLRRKLTQEGRQAFLTDIEGTEIGWIEPEGMIEPRIRYDKLAELLTSCSPVFREYLRLMAMDDAAMPAEDGALMIGFDELADRTLACEDFLPDALGTPFQGDIEELYVRYLGLLLSGAISPSVLDMPLYYESGAFAVNEEAGAAFQYVLDTRPESATAIAVADWRTRLQDLVESGATGEAAYRQLWDGFSVRVAQYAAAAGVRFPRVHLAVREELIDTGMGEDAMGKMEYPILYGEGADADTLAGLTEWMEGDISDTVQGIPSPYSVLRIAREAGPVASVAAGFGSTAWDYVARRGYNFDPATGDHIQLEDLFRPGTDPWALLARDVDRQIALIQDRAGEVEPDLRITGDNYAGITGEQQWYATDEGIVVIFGNGEIYPYGAAEITVLWWRLKDYLK
jgi:hypothetical protein